VRHLPGDHAFEVSLERHDVDDPQQAALRSDLELAAVLLAVE
jgi:hypothetical protein